MEDFTTVCQAMLLGRRLDLSRVERLSIWKERVASPPPPGRDAASIEAFLAAGFGIFKGAATTRPPYGYAGARRPSSRGRAGTRSSASSAGSAAEARSPPELSEGWGEEIRRMGERAGK